MCKFIKGFLINDKLDSNSWKLSPKIENLPRINLLSNVIGQLAHHSGRPHPRIAELEKFEYQEDFQEVICERSNVILGYENAMEEIISVELYAALQKMPQELIDLRSERDECLALEMVAGIDHYSFCQFNKIDVPKLMCRIVGEEDNSNV